MPVLDRDDECPFCGAALRANAAVCRNCGASEEYGWDSVENNVDGLGTGFSPEAYGEDDFDYDDFVAREFPDHADTGQHSSSGPSMKVRLVILALLASLIMTFVFL
ncbi:MAG: zinc ribbon domain-containing protein [Fuerstiella sp.]